MSMPSPTQPVVLRECNVRAIIAEHFVIAEESVALRSKMLISFNIQPEHQDEYMRFMVNVFVPALQKIGLENMGVWHTAYGNYPIRLLVFAADDDEMHEALESETWKQMEGRLKGYVTDYACRVVPFEPGFQF